MTPREAIEQLHGRMIDMALISGYAARDAALRRAAAHRARRGCAVPRRAARHAGSHRHRRPGARAVAARSGRPEPHRSATPSPASTPTASTCGTSSSCRTRACWRAAARSRARSPSWRWASAPRSCPELAVHQNGRPLFDVTLYSVPLPPRKTLLVAPDHYFTLPHLKAFLAAFASAHRSLRAGRRRGRCRSSRRSGSRRGCATPIALRPTRHRRRLSGLSLEDPARLRQVPSLSPRREEAPGM